MPMTEHNQDRQLSGQDHQPSGRSPEESGTAVSGWQRLRSLFGRAPAPSAAHRLYSTLVMRARDPLYYRMLEVPDTPEGRFEILALHAGLAIRRLGQGGEEDRDNAVKGNAGKDMAQSLFDLMFADLDSNLRELGVGDLSVGKQVKRLAGQFYARLDVLNDAFDSGDHERLRPMLATNIYHGIDKPAEGHLDKLIAVLSAIEACLAGQAIADLVEGRISLPDEETHHAACQG